MPDRSEQVKAGIAAKKAAGTYRGGRRSGLSDAVVARIRSEHAAGRSLREIAEGLNRDGVATSQGGSKWWASTVRTVLSR